MIGLLVDTLLFSSEMTSNLPPNLLRLFAPRPPLEFLPPVDTDPGKKKTPKFTALSDFLDRAQGHDLDYQPTETAQQRKDRKVEFDNVARREEAKGHCIGRENSC
jgi:U1 small nuclear ribonucleoprotein